MAQPKKLAWWILGSISVGLLVADYVISISNTIEPRGIVVHHSALPVSDTYREIDAYHRARGFKIFYIYRFYYIGYHYIISPDGTVTRGRPENVKGAHALGHNDFLGICLLGNFDSMSGGQPPTDKQMTALAKLTVRLLAKYRLHLTNIARHCDLSDHTLCPGDLFPYDAYLRRVALMQQHP